MKKLALSVLLVLIAFGVGGTAWASDQTLTTTDLITSYNTRNDGLPSSIAPNTVKALGKGDRFTLEVNDDAIPSVEVFAYLNKLFADKGSGFIEFTFEYKITDTTPTKAQETIPAGMLKGNKLVNVLIFDKGTLATDFTEIGKEAFAETSQLPGVYQADGVTPSDMKTELPGLKTVGERAFYNSSVGAGALTFENKIRTIGKEAYANTTKLAVPITAAMTDGLTTIGEGAFAYSGITNFECADTLETIGPKAFLGSHIGSTFTGGAALKSIGSDAFKNCDLLTLVDLKNSTSLTEIAASLFEGAKELAQVNLPTSIATIGDNAFKNAKKLAGICVGDSIENADFSKSDLVKIGVGAFSFMPEMNNATFILPKTVTEISDYAFDHTRLGRVIFRIEDGTVPSTPADILAVFPKFGKNSFNSPNRGLSFACAEEKITDIVIVWTDPVTGVTERYLNPDVEILTPNLVATHFNGRVDDANTQAIVKLFYEAGFTSPMVRSLTGFDDVVIESLVKALDPNNAEEEVEVPGGGTGGTTPPSGQTPPPPTSEDQTSTGGSSGGCDAGFGLLGALIVLGAVKLRGRKAA
jgi:hypothetical protein